MRINQQKHWTNCANEEGTSPTDRLMRQEACLSIRINLGALLVLSAFASTGSVHCGARHTAGASVRSDRSRCPAKEAGLLQSGPTQGPRWRIRAAQKRRFQRGQARPPAQSEKLKLYCAARSPLTSRVSER